MVTGALGWRRALLAAAEGSVLLVLCVVLPVNVFPDPVVLLLALRAAQTVGAVAVCRRGRVGCTAAVRHRGRL